MRTKISGCCLACSGGHKDGDTWYNNSSPLSCQSCKCNIGVTSCNQVMCDYPFPGCEKYNAPNPDRCCRTCGKYHYTTLGAGIQLYQITTAKESLNPTFEQCNIKYRARSL